MQNISATPTVKSATPSRPGRSQLADWILVAMVSGPLAAPFLAASGLPLLPLIADIIYFMGDHVCPQPEMGLALWPPHIMAVCMRCYGTLGGLVAMRWLFSQNQGRAAYWLPQYGLTGLGLCLALCLVYPAEMVFQHLGWWGYNNWIVTPFGLVSGLGLGAYIMPLLHRQRPTAQ